MLAFHHKTFHHLSLGRVLFEDAAAIAQAVATVGVEGDEGFASQVVSAQESTDDGRGSLAPDGKTEINRVVVTQSMNLALQLGLEVAVALLTRLLHGLQVVLGIGFGRADLEQVGSQSALDEPGDHAGIAGARKVRHQNSRT
ncbi:hypothetical protein D3C73_1160500 [compost metagenome]